MKEIEGDLFDFYDQGEWIVITTNGTVRNDGLLVMGRGVAEQAAKKIPGLQKDLGSVVLRSGNHVWPMLKYRVFSYPVKWKWMEMADPRLIKWGAKELVEKVQAVNNIRQRSIDRIYMVRPGCGNGGLAWAAVRPMIENILDDRFIVVEKPHGR